MTKVKITIQPSAEHPGVLDVKDAMQQVLDFFEALVDESDAGVVVWNLTFAGTNSPFTAEAEAVSLNPAVNVEPIARARAAETAKFLDDVSHGRRPAGDLGKRRKDLMKRLLKRNTNGIGRTVAKFGSLLPHPITVTPKVATAALEVIEEQDSDAFDLYPQKRKRIEIGSVEGSLVDVCTDRNKPAIRIRERKTDREIVCRVDQATQDEIAGSANFLDVWEHRRVVVRGRLYFDDDGKLTRVDATSIRRIVPRQMTIRDIEDPNFTEGVSTAEFIDKLREGGFG
ncbi:hypothetical protein P9272_35480 [Mesorhizobium sp. WSM4976]|uniref:hypothetical protein n=1 Tax=Mesorhizobium sp. WSM4976 TaxID=3038549 RepID=UPI002417501B|nr:hypothetical protein [Mesorhizobium sp. WSM4976]MDG4898790.1 hypothetical protein [Mesorhizobium sp. WSM4976]